MTPKLFEGRRAAGVVKRAMVGCLADPTDDALRARLEALAWMVATETLEMGSSAPRMGRRSGRLVEAGRCEVIFTSPSELETREYVGLRLPSLDDARDVDLAVN